MDVVYSHSAGQGRSGPRLRAYPRGRHGSVREGLAKGMKRTRHKHFPSLRRRALELVALHPEGCTEAVLAAENIPADVLIELARGGLVTSRQRGGGRRTPRTHACAPGPPRRAPRITDDQTPIVAGYELGNVMLTRNYQRQGARFRGASFSSNDSGDVDVQAGCHALESKNSAGTGLEVWSVGCHIGRGSDRLSLEAMVGIGFLIGAS
jgi:hypothetical protein